MSVMEDGPWEDPDKFQEWIEDTTGWDGKTFSLTEDERFWITKAEECLTWFRQAQMFETSGSYETSNVAFNAAFRCLSELPPIPGSLKGT